MENIHDKNLKSKWAAEIEERHFFVTEVQLSKISFPQIR